MQAALAPAISHHGPRSAGYFLVASIMLGLVTVLFTILAALCLRRRHQHTAPRVPAAAAQPAEGDQQPSLSQASPMPVVVVQPDEEELVFAVKDAD